MRTRLSFVLSVLLGLAASGCKNSLNYAPPGGALGCSDPGAICSVGYDDVGDGGPALEASFVYPVGLARDAAGNLFIADRAQNRIRRVDAASGEISTVAGTGEESFAFVSGIPGDEALAASPISVAATDDGTVFWSDERSCSIYAVSPTSGTVSLVAGSHCNGGGGGVLPSDVLFDFDDCSRLRARGNDLVIPSTYRNEIRYWNRGTADVVVAGITVAPGTVTPIATGLQNPCDAAVATDGTLYAIEANYLDCRLRRISPTNVTTFLLGSAGGDSTGCGNGGDGGPVGSAQLNYPSGIALDEAAGLLFISDESRRVRAVNLGGANVSFGGATITTGGIVSIAGETSSGWLTADGLAGTAQRFRESPGQPVVDADGSVLVADPANNVIRRINAADGTMSVVAGFAESGTLEGFLNAPASIARMPGGDLLIAGRTARVFRQSGGNREIFAGTGDPVFTGDGGAATSAGVWATGVTADENGRAFIADAVNHRVRVVDALSGTISTLAGTGNEGTGGDGGPAVNASFQGPHSALVDSSGNLFIADSDRIRYVNLGISPITIAGVTIAPQNIETIAGGNGESFGGDGGPATDASLYLNYYGGELANGMAIADRALYVADSINNRIRRIDLVTGIITTVVGSGSGGADAVGWPVGIAIHGGWLYWTQLDGNLVKRMKLPSGTIEIVAGDGNTGYFGEGVHASQSQLIAPQGLVVDGDGTLYVTDASHRIRRIVP